MAANPRSASTSAAYLAEVSGPTVCTSRVMTSLTCTMSPRDGGEADARAGTESSPGSPDAPGAGPPSLLRGRSGRRRSWRPMARFPRDEGPPRRDRRPASMAVARPDGRTRCSASGRARHLGDLVDVDQAGAEGVETAEGGQARPRVVVGIDGSSGSRDALVHALIAAARRGADLDVVSSYSIQLYYVGGAPLDVPDVAAIRDDQRE